MTCRMSLSHADVGWLMARSNQAAPTARLLHSRLVYPTPSNALPSMNQLALGQDCLCTELPSAFSVSHQAILHCLDCLLGTQDLVHTHVLVLILLVVFKEPATHSHTMLA